LPVNLSNDLSGAGLNIWRGGTAKENKFLVSRVSGSSTLRIQVIDFFPVSFDIASDTIARDA